MIDDYGPFTDDPRGQDDFDDLAHLREIDEHARYVSRYQYILSHLADYADESRPVREAIPIFEEQLKNHEWLLFMLCNQEG